MAVTSDPVSPIRPIGSNITLSCIVELSPAVDVPVTVNFQLSNPNDSLLIITDSSEYDSTYVAMAMVTSFNRDVSGNYTCSAYISSSFLFISNSRSKIALTYVTVGKSCNLL